MYKVHSEYGATDSQSTSPQSADCGRAETVVMTVWRKSLMFNCEGFTVYNAEGNLVFRVDIYASASRNREIVLMDAFGKAIMTIVRKRLALQEKWLIYRGERVGNPELSVKKHVTLTRTKVLAHVTSSGPTRWRDYSVEGSYTDRCCTIYDDCRQNVAEMRRKEGVKGVVLDFDVYRLMVQPNLDEAVAVAVAIIIVLEQMYG